jgi:hypothetical protein
MHSGSWGFINSGVSTFAHPDEVNVDFDELNALISVAGIK